MFKIISYNMRQKAIVFLEKVEKPRKVFVIRTKKEERFLEKILKAVRDYK